MGGGQKNAAPDSTQNRVSKLSDIARRLNSSFFTKQGENIYTIAAQALSEVNGWLRAYLMFRYRFTLNFEWNDNIMKLIKLKRKERNITSCTAEASQAFSKATLLVVKWIRFMYVV